MTKNCAICGGFLPIQGEHVCKNGGVYHSSASGEGHKLIAEDARDRYRRLLSGNESRDVRLWGLQLFYMAQEAGIDAPLTALMRFADLVRADQTAARQAIDRRAVELGIPFVG